MIPNEMIACFLLGSILAYSLLIAVYRLHIHPLKKYPGPRWAALTGLYEIYFALWGPGYFDSEIERMHQSYGPVVRISPDEVHIQKQFLNTNYADCWIKGNKSEAEDSGRYQSVRINPCFVLLKHSKVLSPRFQWHIPTPELREIRVDAGQSELYHGLVQ